MLEFICTLINANNTPPSAETAESIVRSHKAGDCGWEMSLQAFPRNKNQK